MLQSPQNVTKATIGYIIWVRGSDFDHYTLYKVHHCHYTLYKVHIEDVTKSTFMLQRPLLNANDTFMLQSPQNVTKPTIGYIICVRGSDVNNYTLYKVHHYHYTLYKVHIEDVTKSTFMLQRPLLNANDTFML